MAVKRVSLERVGSTNRYLSNLLKENPETGEVMVIADYQESGRGQGGHQWHSLSGENLLVSLLLFPAFLSAFDQFHLSRVASLALIDTLKSLSLTAEIKWPNDILVHERKVAGILIENGIRGKSILHTIIGIGLNLNQTEFPVFPLRATSVKCETGFQSDRDEVADRLLKSLLFRFRQMEEGGASTLEDEYLERLFRLNQSSEFVSDRERFTGAIRGLTDQGELLVEREGRTKSFGFREIQYMIGGN